jgi:hypothetical protein
MLAICRLFFAVMLIAAPLSLSLSFADGSSLPYSEGGYVPDFKGRLCRQPLLPTALFPRFLRLSAWNNRKRLDT